MSLELIGFNHYEQIIKGLAGKLPKESLARIFSEHKTGWDMITNHGTTKGIVMTTMRQKSNPSDLPKVGDWVIYEEIANENKAKILQVLPRYSILSRHLTKTNTKQIIATNIDIMFMVVSIDQVFNIMQLNRYLTIASSGNITPIVVINKTDKQQGVRQIISEINLTHPKLKIISTSTKTQIGLKEFARTIPQGQTAVLVGNSGTGKSSIVNALLNNANQSTKSVGVLGKGRHTTTRRELFVLPNGGIIIDTPGMRTLETTTNPTEHSIFKEMEELSRQCKFRNCDHIKSSGCALQQALIQKTINQKQFDQFLQITTAHKTKPNYNKSRN